MKRFLLFAALSICSFRMSAQSGNLNTSFGVSGKITTPVGSGDDRSYRSTIQPDGKIVLAGNSNNGSNNYFVLVRSI